MIKAKNNVLRRADRRPILFDLFYKEDGLPRPMVILCHGYKGFKDWGCWDLVAETFAEAGFFFVKFNFSHNGGTMGEPMDFPDLEAFAQNNYSKELDDLTAVIDHICSQERPWQAEMDTDKLALIGHSRGGGVVTIKASEDPRIKCLVTWAGVSDFKGRLPQGDALKKWKTDGVYYVTNSRTKQQMPHYFQFYEDLMENEERLTIRHAAEKLQIRHLIIHGEYDIAVSFSEAEALHSWNPKSVLLPVSRANHVFGTSHPWDSDHMPDDLDTVVQATIRFIRGDIDSSE